MSAAWAGAKAAAWAEQIVHGLLEPGGNPSSSGLTSADVASNDGPAGKYAAWQESLPPGVDRRGVPVPWVR